MKTIYFITIFLLLAVTANAETYKYSGRLGLSRRVGTAANQCAYSQSINTRLTRKGTGWMSQNGTYYVNLGKGVYSANATNTVYTINDGFCRLAGKVGISKIGAQKIFVLLQLAGICESGNTIGCEYTGYINKYR